jgi:hypothetical protein
VSGRGLLTQGADPATDAQIQAVLGLVKLRVSTVAVSDAEATESRNAALRILGEVEQTAEQGQFVYAAQVAAMGLLTAQSRASDIRAAEESFVSAATYGFNTPDQIYALTEYAILWADKGQQGCLPLLSEAIRLNYGLQQSFLLRISPQRFFESTLFLAKAEIAMSRLLERGSPDEFESWTRETSRESAFADLRLLTNSFSADNAPRSWAAARMEYGKLMIWHNLGADQGVAAFKDALSVYTRDSDPVIWAEINERLAGALTLTRPPQYETAVKIYEVAMQVRNVKDFPRNYISLCSRLSDTYRQIAKVNADLQNRDQAEQSALRFATVASITWQMQFPDTGSQYEGQHQRLLGELKKTRSQSESAALDEFVDKLKAELSSTVK